MNALRETLTIAAILTAAALAGAAAAAVTPASSAPNHTPATGAEAGAGREFAR